MPWAWLALTVHLVCTGVWIGAVWFNLILLFPMYRAKTKTGMEYLDWMGEHGTRAAPWLYLLAAGTFGSGFALLFASSNGYVLPLLKLGLFAGMLACHLYGTLRVWRHVFFATESEVRGWFLRYQLALGLSGTLGVIALALSAYGRFAAAAP